MFWVVGVWYFGWWECNFIGLYVVWAMVDWSEYEPGVWGEELVVVLILKKYELGAVGNCYTLKLFQEKA